MRILKEIIFTNIAIDDLIRNIQTFKWVYDRERRKGFYGGIGLSHIYCNLTATPMKSI